MYRYCENGHHYISCQPLPLPPAENNREHPVFLFRRPPQSGRAAFSVTALSQLTAAQEEMCLHFMQDPGAFMHAFLAAHPSFLSEQIAMGGKNKQRAELCIEKGFDKI